MLNFKAYTGQRIGLSISKIYLHSNECELVIKWKILFWFYPNSTNRRSGPTVPMGRIARPTDLMGRIARLKWLGGPFFP